MARKITLTSLRTALSRTDSGQAHSFIHAQAKLALCKDLSSNELDLLFRMMNIFIVYGDGDLQKMAYSMALNYGLLSNDYSILDSFARQLRYYPVRMLISAHLDKASIQYEQNESPDELFARSLTDVYKDEYYQSEQQYYLNRTVKDKDNLVVVAPTSYGKSHLMVGKAVQRYANGSNVCIVVPTKSLLSQTLSMAIKANKGRSGIITHPDMFVKKYEASPFLAIMTQERLLALLAKWPNLTFHYLFIDESHNMLKDEERSLTLSRAVLIAKNRSDQLKIDYFSPFIANPEKNMRLVNGLTSEKQEINSITEYMKIPRYYFWDNRTKKLQLFDQFTDRYYDDGAAYDNYLKFIFGQADDKNIIYLNKPADVERFADMIADHLPEVKYSTEEKEIIDDACDIFSKYVHQSYNLIRVLRRGVVFNHGKMPEIIKGHVEYLYRKIGKVKYIVTTSTLLEGVNVPASSLFLVNYSRGGGNLDISDFKNLAGRVGRYNTIFNYENPKIELLSPRVYVVGNDEYMTDKANPKNFLATHAKEGVSVKDDVANPLIASYDGNDKESRLINETTIVANIDKTHADQYKSIINSQPMLARTDLGASCFVHNVKMFDVIRYEHDIRNKISHLSGRPIRDGDTLLQSIISVFLKTTYTTDIKIDKHRYGNWIYLLYTQEYLKDIYSKIIKDKTSNDTNFSTLVARSIASWKRNTSKPVYVGDLGNCDARGQSDSRWNKYVIFNEHNKNLMPSYAASLAKENLENVENYIIPFVEIFNDFSLIEEPFYKRIKYGTDDDFVIALLRSGFDFSLAKLMAEDNTMRELIIIDQEAPICSDKDRLLAIMEENNISLMYKNSARELL